MYFIVKDSKISSFNHKILKKCNMLYPSLWLQLQNKIQVNQ